MAIEDIGVAEPVALSEADLSVLTCQTQQMRRLACPLRTTWRLQQRLFICSWRLRSAASDKHDYWVWRDGCKIGAMCLAARTACSRILMLGVGASTCMSVAAGRGVDGLESRGLIGSIQFMVLV